MSRGSLERRLLALQFPKYTGEVADLIGRTQRENPGCLDTSDIVLNAIWGKFRDDFSWLNTKASKGDEAEKQSARDGVLTQSGRKALRDYIDKARDFEAEIGDMEDDAFEEFAKSTIQKEDQEKRAKREARGREDDRWAFFNEAAAAADLAHWRAVSAWSPDEAVALSLGKNPEVVNPDTLKPYKRVIGPSLFREEFARRLDLVERALRAGELLNPIRPTQFMEWAANHGLDTPPEFQKLDASCAEKAADEVHLNTLHKLHSILLAVAIRKYQYDVTLGENEIQKGVFAAIEDDVVEAGLSVSSRFIRDQIKTARAWVVQTSLPLATRFGKKPR